jgi:hypothetical protein
MADARSNPSLDDLLARAEDLALFSMRARGKVLPTLLAVGTGGPICFIPSSLKDERAKDNFANIALPARARGRAMAWETFDPAKLGARFWPRPTGCGWGG